MRRLIIAAAAVAALATTGLLAGTPAQAMPLSGLASQATSSATPVYLRCRWVWEYGYRVRRCWEVYDRPAYYYAPRPRYGYGYYGGYGYRGGY